MAINRQRQSVSYGLSQPLIGTPPEPIISTRVPATTDRAEIGTTWINKSANTAFVLASIVANSATWTPTTVNAGATIATGNLTVSTGNLFVTAGDILVVAGSITASAGNIATSTGHITSASNVTATESVFVAGDEGTGVASQVAFTNVVDETVSTGAGKVLMKTANPGDSSGWLKIYSGTDIRFVPYWTNLSP